MSDLSEATNTPPIDLFKDRDLSPIVKLYINFCHGKQIYRAGWLRQGLAADKVERVAGHTEGVIVLANIIAKNTFPELNIDHINELAAFHELAESLVGDVIRHGAVYEGMTRDEKKDRERKAIEQMFAEFSSEVQTYHLNLFDEMRYTKTPEAKFVDYVDKLESCFQALIYEHQYKADLSEFFINVRNYIHDNTKLLDILTELESLRPSS